MYVLNPALERTRRRERRCLILCEWSTIPAVITVLLRSVRGQDSPPGTPAARVGDAEESTNARSVYEFSVKGRVLQSVDGMR